MIWDPFFDKNGGEQAIILLDELSHMAVWADHRARDWTSRTQVDLSKAPSDSDHYMDMMRRGVTAALVDDVLQPLLFPWPR